MHGNETAQYLRNCRHYNVDQDCLRKPYKDLQGSREGANFKRTVQFSKAVQFQATFIVQVAITFALY